MSSEESPTFSNAELEALAESALPRYQRLGADPKDLLFYHASGYTYHRTANELGLKEPDVRSRTTKLYRSFNFPFPIESEYAQSVLAILDRLENALKKAQAPTEPEPAPAPEDNVVELVPPDEPPPDIVEDILSLSPAIREEQELDFTAPAEPEDIMPTSMVSVLHPSPARKERKPRIPRVKKVPVPEPDVGPILEHISLMSGRGRGEFRDLHTLVQRACIVLLWH